MEIVEKFSFLVLPLILLVASFIILLGKKKDYFSSFLKGATDGATSAVKLLPTMCALIVGVSMFTGSGISDFIAHILSPFFDKIGVPSEIFPLILTRPISGSASLATFGEILSSNGPDSYASLCASIIMASTDTVIYVICIYFSASRIKHTRHALPIALFISILSIFLSCILARLFF
ncbi:MAG: spore maturation protein [Clostridia bacterium]|nr:spore maturation protein [Clostridia bacterium]